MNPPAEEKNDCRDLCGGALVWLILPRIEATHGMGCGTASNPVASFEDLYAL